MDAQTGNKRTCEVLILALMEDDRLWSTNDVLKCNKLAILITIDCVKSTNLKTYLCSFDFRKQVLQILVDIRKYI